MADSKWFIFQSKLVIYIGKFVELYDWRNRKQVHGMYGMIKLKKMSTLIAKNSHNLSFHWIIDMSSILHSAYVISRNQDIFMFYINNDIN